MSNNSIFRLKTAEHTPVIGHWQHQCFDGRLCLFLPGRSIISSSCRPRGPALGATKRTTRGQKGDLSKTRAHRAILGPCARVDGTLHVIQWLPTTGSGSVLRLASACDPGPALRGIDVGDVGLSSPLTDRGWPRRVTTAQPRLQWRVWYGLQFDWTTSVCTALTTQTKPQCDMTLNHCNS